MLITIAVLCFEHQWNFVTYIDLSFISTLELSKIAAINPVQQL